VPQGEGPVLWFKPQYHKKKEKEKKIPVSYFVRINKLNLKYL
jgi:hypothetical protein